MNHQAAKVCILDYGSGNVRSVYNIVSSLATDVVISNKKSDILPATHLILPGVGAFSAAMNFIREKIDLSAVQESVLKQKKPFLGICVGMQVLATTGHEFGKHSGLGWIRGEVKKLISPQMVLPHVGWNNLITENKSPLLENIDDNQDFYFVHSYHFVPKNKKLVIARTDYGEKFCSIVQQDNILGVQFHPEKSQDAGKALLQNFLKL